VYHSGIAEMKSARAKKHHTTAWLRAKTSKNGG
jgi:hypothetical protein